MPKPYGAYSRLTLLAISVAGAFYSNAAAFAHDHDAKVVPADAAQQLERPVLFKCQGGTNLLVQFSNSDSKFFVVVNAGDGAHKLPIKPWVDLEPLITWSDGRRKLVWSEGVHLSWSDGGRELSCARAEGEHHH